MYKIIQVVLREENVGRGGGGGGAKPQVVQRFPEVQPFSAHTVHVRQSLTSLRSLIMGIS